MKKLLAVLLAAALLGGCTTRTDHGPCIGLMNTANPAKEYELSIWNGFVAFIFSETIIVPIWTIAADIQCPVGDKK